MITASELVRYLETKVGCGYVWGTKGAICTLALIEQLRVGTKDNSQSSFHDGNNGYTYAAKCKKWLGKQVFDCGGLVDFFFAIDRSANGYYAACTEKGPITSIPNTPGIFIFMHSTLTNSKYHVGYLTSTGRVIEARNVDVGVCVTALKDRKWTHWGRCDLIDYQGGNMSLQSGSIGDSVTLWQTALLHVGYKLPVWGADGDFGGETTVATNEFKANQGLAQDGIVDDLCWGKMTAQLFVQPAEQPTVDLKPELDLANAKLAGAVAALEAANGSIDASVSVLAAANANIVTLEAERTRLNSAVGVAINDGIGWQTQAEKQKLILAGVEKAMDTLNSVRAV